MACYGIHSWTLLGLVGAFLDLAIAYVLLWCSTAAYFLSKFLGFFGLSFPCPCNGLYGGGNAVFCLQKLLVDYPMDKIYSVQLSIRRKFPFGSVWGWNDDQLLHFKVISERQLGNGVVEVQGEASCSPFSILDAENFQQMNRVTMNNDFGVKKGGFHLKGKGAVQHNQRPGIRHRCMSSEDISKVSLSSSCDTMRSDMQVVPLPQPENKMTSDSTADENDKEENLPVEGIQAKYSPDFEPKYYVHEKNSEEEDVDSLESGGNSSRHQPLIDSQDENAVRILEHALEEEQAARDALYDELESERIAAATAADEAMAMISRLQEEKAAVQLEARQYQRILEEKSSYDFEEMSILKEIIVRREWEKHFLEKEVESYKRMLLERQQSEGDANDVTYDSASDVPHEDQTSMVCQPSGSTVQGEGMQNEHNIPDDASLSIEDDRQLSSVSRYKLHQTDVRSQEFNGEGNMGQLQNENLHSSEGGSLSTTKTCETSRMSNRENGRGMNSQCEDTNPKEQHVYDVHVIDDASSCATASSVEMDQELGRSGSDMFSNLPPLSRSNSSHRSKPSAMRRNSMSVIDRASSLGMDQEMSSSSSDMFSAFPPLRRSSSSDLRRHSISAIDHEKVKINNEVGLLRDRLRNIRAGREKLHISLEHLEKDKSQLVLLEDIGNLLREIRQLTEPQKTMQRTSLPPQPSKVTSKKKRSKGSPVGVHQSS